MKDYLRNAFVICCILFTALTLIHFFRGKELATEVVWGFIGISVFSGAMTFLLPENEHWSKRRALISQFIYVGVIMIAIMAITYFMEWEFSFRVMAMNFVIVMLIFVLIKYWVFNKDRRDAELLNEALKRRR